MTRARRADHHAAAALEYEALIDGRRVEASLRFHRSWIGECDVLCHPAADRFHQRAIGLAALRWVRRRSGVMRRGLDAMHRIGERIEENAFAAIERYERRHWLRIGRAEVADRLA